MMHRQAAHNTTERAIALASAFGISLSLLLSSTSLAHANTLGTLTIRTNSADSSEADIDAILSGAAQGDISANRIMEVKPGETLNDLLTAQGISANQRAAALKALGELYDLTQIKPGDSIETSMSASLDGAGDNQLVALHLRPAYGGTLSVVAGTDGAFHRLGTAANRVNTVTSGITTRHGTIQTSLVPDLLAASVPRDVAEDVAEAFNHDNETSSAKLKGARFTVVYETAKTGNRTKHVMRYAELGERGIPHRVYRYETNDGKVAFMDENGRGIMPMALAAPIHNARMTSPFGWRVHPVLKVRKFHNGVDFAAPRGTPIYAAEDGTIDTIGWRGNYGRFLKLKHNDRVTTTYGHMSGFAKGLRKGDTVKKGQVIAYVGSSGLSTGNHLYYEVLVDNKHVDPARSEVMLSLNLDGSSLVRFHSYVARLSEAQ
ncbi:MAG: M23 family metallopeptidase [Parvibaculum sp.]|nr:M23 family metallopeptidase [Parvibaculum sp.]